MAHQIETHGNRAAAIFARQDAWHRLGTTIEGRAFTAEEAMTLGHLGGWDVRKSPLHTTIMDANGVTNIEVPDKFATVRTNPFTGEPEPLGVVGAGYTVLQNEEHAEFLNALADESGAIFDTAGSLRGGRQTFLTMRMPDTMQIGGVDDVTVNIAALNSHDGTSAFRLLVTPVRVVCANTQAAALGNHRGSVSIRHTRNARSAVAQAREALGLTFKWVAEFEAEAERMINTTMSGGEFEKMMHALWGAPATAEDSTRAQNTDATRRDTLWSLWENASTQDGIRGTAWAGYQAVTEYVDHFAPVRGKGDHTAKATARAERLLTSDEPNRLKLAAWKALTPA